MEELNLLLGWLFRASNWLPDLAPQLEEDRFGGHCGVTECRAVRTYKPISYSIIPLVLSKSERDKDIKRETLSDRRRKERRDQRKKEDKPREKERDRRREREGS